MARYVFGGTADFVILAGDNVTVGAITGKATVLYPGAALTFWNAESGGLQHTDLQDMTGSAIAAGIVTAGTNGEVPRFQGPDGVVRMFVDAGQGGRREMTALNVGDQLTAVAALEAKLADINRVIISATAPSSPVQDDIWLDIS